MTTVVFMLLALLFTAAAASALPSSLDLSRACDDVSIGPPFDVALALPRDWSLVSSPWPHEAACKPFAASLPGGVWSSEPCATIRAEAIVAGGSEVCDSSVRLSEPDAECVCATMITAGLLDALPCDFYVADGELSGLTLTAPGVYCPSNPAHNYFVAKALTLVGNSTGRFVFKGIWISSGHVVLEGELLADNVVNIIAHSDLPYAHGAHAGSANMTFISGVPFNVNGSVQIGRLLSTEFGRSGLKLHDGSEVQFTAQ